MGDTIHAPEAQFEDPSITVAFDVDQKAAAATRQKAFADAAEGGYFVSFDHSRFPESDGSKREVSATAASPSHTSMIPPGREVRKRPIRPKDIERCVPNVTPRFRGVLFGSIRH
jgi:hypothetical protein